MPNTGYIAAAASGLAAGRKMADSSPSGAYALVNGLPYPRLSTPCPKKEPTVFSTYLCHTLT